MAEVQSPAQDSALTVPVTQPESPPINSSLRIGLLSLIVLIGIALRFWGIGWSLPDNRHPLASYHPDEAVNYYQASAQVDLLAGKFDVGFYNYGAFYYYLVD